MGARILELIEKIRGKPLEPEEKDLFLRIQEELGCDDDDAIWNIVALLEYQKLFYLALPEKIAEQSEKILAGFKKSAESEIKKAQGNLATQVVEGAKKNQQTSQFVNLDAACYGDSDPVFPDLQPDDVGRLSSWSGHGSAAIIHVSHAIRGNPRLAILGSGGNFRLLDI